jgi:ABC-type polysaccharide/polyol phosphate transport system ATPase subunit
MARIELVNANLVYRIRQYHRLTLKEMLVRQMFRRSVNPVIEVHALKDVSFSVREGERFGVIGHNGAGKSTLLKLLADIYPVESGIRIVEGKISSLFDISLGFEPEANGWENIAFRSYLQGETPRTLLPKLRQIADFSELGDYLKMPVRYYSAGMLMRLAFSIATAVEPEILLVDEVFNVGDLAFQEKARQRMRELVKRAQIMVLVSHDLNTLANNCDRVLWLEGGRVQQIGPAAEVIRAYQNHVRARQQAA